MRTPKKVVICCDGTGNSFDNLDEDSNVVKLYSSLTINEEQIGYYHPGVGTMGDPNSRSSVGRWISKARGLAFGKGLASNVADAYRYLMDNYADGDEIYLIGFSRGAYTARVLASLIHVFGLLCAGNHDLIPYIYNLYSKRSNEASHKNRTFPEDKAFKWQFSHSEPVTIHFCGLWDTVSSYGWIYDPIDLPFLGDNPIIRTGRHAISIDERRCYYQDNLWGEPRHGQDIRQVWFSGVHADVGGSYPEATCGLSKIALEWMFAEAAKAGMLIDQVKARTVLGRAVAFPNVGLPTYAAPDHNAERHEQLKGVGWWLLEYLPHKDPHLKNGWYLPRGRRRIIPQRSYIHETVLTGRHCPMHLPEYSIEPLCPF